MSEELKKGIPKAIVQGKKGFTPEEREQHDAEFEKILRECGVLGENQSLKELTCKN